jgi:hypothetical protein
VHINTPRHPRTKKDTKIAIERQQILRQEALEEWKNRRSCENGREGKYAITVMADNSNTNGRAHTHSMSKSGGDTLERQETILTIGKLKLRGQDDDLPQ